MTQLPAEWNLVWAEYDRRVAPRSAIPAAARRAAKQRSPRVSDRTLVSFGLVLALLPTLAVGALLAGRSVVDRSGHPAAMQAEAGARETADPEVALHRARASLHPDFRVLLAANRRR